MPRKNRLIAQLALAFGGWMGFAPTAVLAQQSDDAQKLERVEITGSSIKRIEGETALPVQVITREEIQKTGATTAEQLLQTVSAIASSGTITASTVSSATTGGISSVSLRGLTSLRTLVLINGRRISPYGIGFTGDSVSVDVNSIPLAAVERVEILKDGASAIYGSDAIAGVVNFILRKDFKGAELSAEYGDTSDGGARLQRVSGAYGYGDLGRDRFNLMLLASYQKEDPLFGGQRKFASKGYNEAAQNTTTSGNSFPANIFLLDSGLTRNPTAPDCPGPYATLDPLFPPNRCRFDPSPLVQLVPAAERSNIFGSAKFALTPDLEAFVEASFNRNRQNNVIQPVPLSDQFSIPDNHPLFNQAPYNGLYPARFGALAGQPTGLPPGFSTILLKPGDKYYPTDYVQSIVGAGNPLEPLAIRYRSAVTGDRNITDVSEAPRLTLGLKGTASGWDFDTAVLYSASKLVEHVNGGFPALSKILPLLNSGQVNFFGPNTPEIDDQLKATQFVGDAFKIDTSITSLAAKASRELLQFPGGPLAVALGAEIREEKYKFDPSAAIASGDISGYGGNFLVTDRSRNVTAAFAEISVPIVKGLEADGAVRYDHYEGVGNSTTPKLSLRWQPTRSILVRASAGRGFRAPSLQDLYLPQQTGVTPNGLNDPVRCPTTGSSIDCATQFATTLGGNPALKPEKSNNYTLGLVLEPINNVSVAIDAFKIDLKDTIVNGVTASIILSDLNKYGSLVTRGPISPGFPNLPGPIVNIDQTNINLGETKVAGFDVDAKWAIPAGEWGRFTIALNGTYFSKYDVQNPDGTFTGGIDQINTATGGVIPRWRHYLSLDWTRGPWNMNVAQNYQTNYRDLCGNADPNCGVTTQPPLVSAYQTFDLQGTYSGFKNLKLTLGAKNIFNTDPPYTNSGGAVSFQAGYDPEYADPRGRFIYGRVTYSIR